MVNQAYLVLALNANLHFNPCGRILFVYLDPFVTGCDKNLFVYVYLCICVCVVGFYLCISDTSHSLHLRLNTNSTITGQYCAGLARCMLKKKNFEPSKSVKYCSLAFIVGTCGKIANPWIILCVEMISVTVVLMDHLLWIILEVAWLGHVDSAGTLRCIVSPPPSIQTPQSPTRAQTSADNRVTENISNNRVTKRNDNLC